MYKQDEYERLRRRLAIDQMQLDKELIELAPDTQTVAEYCAEAIHFRDGMAHVLKVAEAEAAQALRVGEKPPSESQISTRIALDPNVQEAQQSYDEHKKDAAMWTALVNSFGEKGSSLRRICEMTMAGFLTPSTLYNNRKDEMHDARKAAGELRERLKTR